MENQKYFEVEVKFQHLGILDSFNAEAISKYGCEGIYDGGLDEAQIDEHLGELSFCGGNLPENCVDTLEDLLENQNQIYYFYNIEQAEVFKKYAQTQKHIISAVLEEKKSEDWNTNWRNNFSKIELDNYDFTIYPSWDENINTEKEHILVYPGQGFGTGTHETTRMCLEILEEIELSEMKHVLDFGCGSGILGIGVQKLNPNSQCVYYDIDEAALENCLQNIEINKTKNFKIISPSQKSEMLDDKYNLIFANILEHVLIGESEFIHSLKTKYLVLSGLLNTQAQGIIDHYEQLGFKLLKHDSRGDWSCLLMER